MSPFAHAPFGIIDQTIMFLYDLTHQVVVCSACKSCILPERCSQERHLQSEPHRLFGDALDTAVELLSSYGLRTVRELRECRPQPGDKCPPIEQLASYAGFHCLQADCDYSTRHLLGMKRHTGSAYKIKAKDHKKSPL